jgi:hypothetical protein
MWRGKRRYGKICTGKGKSESSHRISWEIHNGKVPEGMWVLHKCDSGRCIRPSHLFLGTYKDNINDMLQKRRNVRGEKVGTSKLTNKAVKEIRSKYKKYSREFNHRYFSEKFGVSVSAVHFVIKGRMWKHIGG